MEWTPFTGVMFKRVAEGDVNVAGPKSWTNQVAGQHRVAGQSSLETGPGPDQHAGAAYRGRRADDPAAHQKLRFGRFVYKNYAVKFSSLRSMHVQKDATTWSRSIAMSFSCSKIPFTTSTTYALEMYEIVTSLC